MLQVAALFHQQSPAAFSRSLQARRRSRCILTVVCSTFAAISRTASSSVMSSTRIAPLSESVDGHCLTARGGEPQRVVISG